MVDLSRGDIRERLYRVVVSPTPSGVNIFGLTATGGGVPLGRNRYIVRLEMAGSSGAGTVQAFRVKSTAAVGSPITPPWNVAAAANLDEPTNYDVENALIRIPGGEDVQLQASVSGPQVGVLYYDDEVHG